MSDDTKTVVIVDDSPVVRTLLKHIIEGSREFTVVGQAADGIEGVAMIKKLRPNVATMDAQMPKMDGPSAIRQIMEECPTAIVLCSVIATEGAPVVLDALQAGAFDFITKPKSVLADTSEFGPLLLEKLREALSANRESLAAPVQEIKPATGSSAAQFLAGSTEIVVFGTSTGGPKALLSVLPGLPASFPAAVVLALQGMPGPILRLIADQLSKVCAMPVELALAEGPLTLGRITILPADHHAMVVRGAEALPRLKLMDRNLSGEQTPSLNGLFSSVAVACPGKCVGILLTGTGKDGALGMKKIHQTGGKTIAEDKNTSIVFDKPGAAIAMDVVDLVLPNYKICAGILELLGSSRDARPEGQQ